MAAFSRIGIVGKPDEPNVAPTIQALVAHLRGRGCDVVASSGFHGVPDDVELVSENELGDYADLIVVVGGDGTLLAASRAVSAKQVPLLGVNLGRLGFMVDVLPETMCGTLDEVLKGNYVTDERLLLSAEVHQPNKVLGPFLALNDVVVRSQEFARMIEFDTVMDGTFISRHRADGIIISTPTGSTAYALSCGGPVLHPSLNALALVPISPHTLSDRPLIIDGDRCVDVVVGTPIKTIGLFTCDGQISEPLESGDRVSVRRADFGLKLIHPVGYDYFNILRNKLHWGRGQDALIPR